MSSQEFHQLLGVLPALSLEQLQRLRHECKMAAVTAKRDESLVRTGDELADQELQRRLMEVGLVSEIKPPARHMPSQRGYVPITIGGEPLSETIIRERR